MSALAAPVTISRTAAAVHQTLAEHRPDLGDAFVAEFHSAMRVTDADFDTTRIDRLVGRWWAQACALVNPDPEVEAAHARLQAGDTSDLVESWCRQPDGSQQVYRRGLDGEWVFDRVIPAA
jgi:hypothetical protein